MEKCLLYLFSIGSQFLDFIHWMVFDLFFYCVTVKTIYTHALFATNKRIHCIWRCCWIHIIDNTFQNLKNALQGIENKRRSLTLSIDNAWSNKNFLFYLTFRMLQHISSEVNGYNCYKHFKKYKNKEGNWWQDKKQWQNWYYR